MADRVSPIQRSENMRRIKGKDTTPEMVVRRLIHSMGYRFRLHGKDLPGKPDLVFRPRRKAIFVHGCFWHQHAGCRDGRPPTSNTTYWAAKLERNLTRDERARADLEACGWAVYVIWECETHDRAQLCERLAAFLE